MRLFVGISLPEDISDALSSLEAPLQGANWVESQDYHISLRWIGEVEKSLAYELDDALLRIELPAFELRFAGVDFFGGYDPKALTAPIEPCPALHELHRAVDRAAQSVGIPPDKRAKFRPHATLARLKSPDLDRFARYLERHARFQTELFHVTRFAMFSTKPQMGGGPYLIEQTYDLKHYDDYEDDDTGSRPGA
jgi:RNA 2',3'-cyclic 3'-phosphodiesterase